MSMSRGASAEARPTAWISGKFFFSNWSPTTAVALAPNVFARSSAAWASAEGDMSLAGVLMRSRPSVTDSAISAALSLTALSAITRSAAFRPSALYRLKP
jgi:hypothetical protein